MVMFTLETCLSACCLQNALGLLLPSAPPSLALAMTAVPTALAREWTAVLIAQHTSSMLSSLAVQHDVVLAA
jgi:hypothetical protein